MAGEVQEDEVARFGSGRQAIQRDGRPRGQAGIGHVVRQHLHLARREAALLQQCAYELHVILGTIQVQRRAGREARILRYSHQQRMALRRVGRRCLVPVRAGAVPSSAAGSDAVAAQPAALPGGAEVAASARPTAHAIPYFFHNVPSLRTRTVDPSAAVLTPTKAPVGTGGVSQPNVVGLNL